MKLGKISESVLKRSILKPIKTKREEIVSGAGVGEDCAIFTFPKGEFLVTCMQEAAVAVQADMAALLVKCANNLATDGAEPIAAMITLVLPPHVDESALKALMSQAESTCAKLQIQIAGGQTRVSEQVNSVIAVVTGIGSAPKDAVRTTKGAEPGQDIVVSKWIGLEGTYRLAGENREKLLARYPEHLVEEAEGFDKYLSIVPEAATAVKSGVCVMHDASQGGIFAALWELAECSGVGLTIDLKKLPIRQETVEVCELCEANPYEMPSGGCLIMTSQDGPGLVTALEAEQIPATVIGKITDSNDRIVINDDEVRFLTRP